VLGTLDNVIDGTIKDPGRRQQRLEVVRAQLVHSIEMIRNLAFLSQLASAEGSLGLKEKATDVIIPAIVIEAAQFFQETAAQRGIKIDLVEPNTQYTVKGHIHLLRQVFMNLFENGVKYSDNDTRVLVKPHGQKHTGHLLVEIENIGCGFEQDEKERIFELGYRGLAAENIKSTGTGLGLFICKRILEIAHGANIEAEHSPTRRRTLFRIRFPQYTLGEDYVKGKRERGRPIDR